MLTTIWNQSPAERCIISAAFRKAFITVITESITKNVATDNMVSLLVQIWWV